MKRWIAGAMIFFLLFETGTVYTADGYVYTKNGRFYADGDMLEIRSISVDAIEYLASDDTYANVAMLGFNTVRLQIFASDLKAENGRYDLSVLDDHIAYAEKNGIRLLINMHYEPGRNPVSVVSGLWTQEENRVQLKEMWRQIAVRYAGNNDVLGYALLSEPGPLAETLEEGLETYRELITELIRIVRAVDPKHMIVVESLHRVYHADGGIEYTALQDREDMYFVMPKEDNIAYEFHFYEILRYTAQLNDIGMIIPSLVYPSRLVISRKDEVWVDQSSDAGTVQYNQTESLFVASGILYANQDGSDVNSFVSGSMRIEGADEDTQISIDSFGIVEYDADGKKLGTLLSVWNGASNGFNVMRNGEYSWGDFQYGPLWLDTLAGSVTIVSDDRLSVIPGHGYQSYAYIRVFGAPDGFCYTQQIDRYTAGEIDCYNADYIEKLLDLYAACADKYGLALLMGEFGLVKTAYGNNRGGAQWLDDVVSACLERGISYNYFDYADDTYGLMNAKMDTVNLEMLTALVHANLR